MRSKGFTLVEILVVMLIITVVISLTVLSVTSTGRDSQLDEESRRIEGLVGLLHERALLEGRDFGLRIEPAAYEFVVYDSRRDRWLMLDQEREFRHRELPKGISFQLQLDSQTVVIKADRSEPVRRRAAQSANRNRRERRRHAVSPHLAARRHAGQGSGRWRCARQDFAREFQQSGKAQLSALAATLAALRWSRCSSPSWSSRWG